MKRNPPEAAIMLRLRTQGCYVGALMLAVCLVSIGCIHGHTTWTSQVSRKFVIQAVRPEQYFIRVPHHGDFSIPPDGRVTVRYSEVNKYSDMKYADWIITSHASSDVKALYVMRGDKVVKKIALTPLKDFLTRYRPDEQGYLIVELDRE